MEKLTITEVFAEIKLTREKIQKKIQQIRQYCGQQGRLRDPLEKQGGSEAFVKAEMQSFNDLHERLVRMLNAVHKSNLVTNATIEGVTKTVYAWLLWRKEIFKDQATLYAQMLSQAANLRSAETTAGRTRNAFGPSEPATSEPAQVSIYFDEKAIMAASEKCSSTLAKLDGQLSLLNATTVVEF